MAATDYDARKIAEHFDTYGDNEWNRLVKTPVDEVSLYIHTHYLRRYVPQGGRVLEIGAGAGRFTQVLAGIGANIVVADISQGQLALNQRYARRFDFAHAVEAWQQADICAMPQFADESFDCVVAYGGPLSYVMDRRDVAIQECLRVLKPDGALLFSVMSIWGSAHAALNGVLSLPVALNQQITTTGDLTPQVMPGRTDNMHLFRASELRQWLTHFDVQVEALSASNGLCIGWNEHLAEICNDEEKWQELLRMEVEACAEEESLNMGTHLLAVVRKNEFNR